ncbi:hypothetical protein [Actinokineospora bangkokensis]|uniref:Uncharacterized protein n=1 Tax=Actinokineospora bangkokensis TaxID=1193682 RepID=A0A1Q9LQP1_9PSEU|nr:hypothetical protein [Actinokineospora bangkokensis]OLR94311.1 hypothetical protein BJP25_11090 [Actinokineospora bangkokensis]
MTAAELSQSTTPAGGLDLGAYRRGLGWPADGDEHGVYLDLSGDHVTGLRVAAGLGAEVQWWLRLRMLAGPVLATPGSRTDWTFLVQPFPEGSRRPLPLAVEAVTTLVMLPTATTPHEVAHWATAPDPANPTLPQASSVIGAVRSVLHGNRF